MEQPDEKKQKERVGNPKETDGNYQKQTRRQNIFKKGVLKEGKWGKGLGVQAASS